MKQPLIEDNAIACQRAIRLAHCVVAKLIICYLTALTRCIYAANFTVATNPTAAEIRADQSRWQMV
jgi:hypothetical protein